ncbi:MAG: hypothetical protein ACOC3I_10125, partial [Verrucomicrobiota bacterium]
MRSLLGGVVASAALSSVLHAGSFAEVSPHLDLEGNFVAFADFEGDGEAIGRQLNSIYQEVLATVPDVPPIPLDFPALFETLGFGSVRSLGASSLRVDDDLFVNRAVTLADGELTGLFGLYGSETTTFRAAQFAPADTTTALSGQLRLTTLRDSIVAVLTQIMGPMGQGMAQQQLMSPLPGTDVTINEVIEAFSETMHFAMQQDFSNPLEPQFRIYAEIDGAGPLLARLEPLGESLPVVFTEGDNALTADLSALIQGAPMGLFLTAPAEGDKLILYTHEDWGADASGDKLADSDAFRKVASRLPEEAILHSYSAGFDMTQITSMVAQDPNLAPFLPLIEESVDLLLGDFLAPNASALYYASEEVLVSEQYAAYSYKDALVVLPAAFAGGIAAATIPAMQQVQTTSQEKAITNNLRQLASAAQQYMLETGETEV